jgi:hypothetical protein
MLTWIVTNQPGGAELLVQAYGFPGMRRRAVKKLLRDWSAWFDKPLNRKRRVRRRRGFCDRSFYLGNLFDALEIPRNEGD